MEKQVYDYYSNVNFEILRLIPPEALTILEIGCGTGALAATYRMRNPHGKYIGIEINDKAATQARQHIDEVYVDDVEKFSFSQCVNENEKIDCLIYGDVLEHLHDPWRILQEHTQYLSDDGIVLACIPNVQHWSVFVNLLCGQWHYKDSGLFDRTHLRYFTLESIRELFSSAGLIIYDIISRTNPIPDQAKEMLQLAGQTVGADWRLLEKQVKALQYVVRAGKKPPVKRFLVQSVIGEPKVCARVRIQEPNAFLETKPGIRVVSAEKQIDLGIKRANENKVVIWQRIPIQDDGKIKKLIDLGYLIICELDDHPVRWPHLYNERELSSYHGIQTSTPALREYLKQFNPNVTVFPNQIAELPPKREYEEKGNVSIFFGAINRQEDWQAILPELNAVLAAYGDKVHIQVVHDKAFYDALQTKYKQFTPTCTYQEYVNVLRQCDMALLPLLPTEFNCAKSDLKFLECAAHGVAVLASPTVYADTIIEGETGLLYRSLEEFAKKLRFFLDSPQERQKMAQQAYEWVQEHRMLRDHYQKRLEWYESLLANYEYHTQELFKRLQKYDLQSRT